MGVVFDFGYIAGRARGMLAFKFWRHDVVILIGQDHAEVPGFAGLDFYHQGNCIRSRNIKYPLSFKVTVPVRRPFAAVDKHLVPALRVQVNPGFPLNRERRKRIDNSFFRIYKVFERNIPPAFSDHDFFYRKTGPGKLNHLFGQKRKIKVSGPVFFKGADDGPQPERGQALGKFSPLFRVLLIKKLFQRKIDLQDDPVFVRNALRRGKIPFHQVQRVNNTVSAENIRKIDQIRQI